MFDWISHNKELFLQSHTEIGVSYQHALDLQTQHNHFAMNSMVSGKAVLNMLLGQNKKRLGQRRRRGRWIRIGSTDHAEPLPVHFAIWEPVQGTGPSSCSYSRSPLHFTL